jgi:hypothetical protein
MATYKTAPRVDYDVSFQEVAQRLFDLTSNRLRHGRSVAEKGSYSFRATSPSQETVVKILIFQRAFGISMQGELPWRDDGVYVLVRTNDEYGETLWGDQFAMDSRFRARMSRNENVGTAPNYTARFAYFPVMAGESLDAIAEFIASLVEKVSGITAGGPP